MIKPSSNKEVCVMLKTKRSKLFFALAATILLTGCSPKIEDNDIHARPEWYDNEIMSDLDVKDNKLSDLYDKLAASDSSNTCIMDDIFMKVAENIFGSYEEIQENAAKIATTEAGLKNPDVAAFTSAHKYYDLQDNKYVQNDEVKTMTAEQEMIVKAQKLLDLYNFIRDEIYDHFYNKVSKDSTFKNRDGYYEEYRFAQSLINDMYKLSNECYLVEGRYFDVNNVDKTKFFGTIPSGESNIIFTPDSIKRDEYEDHYFHLDYYEDYIKRNVIKSIFKNLLTEEYIFLNKYPTLGRNYSRKIDYITLPLTTETSDFISKLTKAFAVQYIGTMGANGESVPDQDTNIHFEVLADAYKGVNLSDKAKSLLDLTNPTVYTFLIPSGDGVEEIDVYEGTEIYQNLFKDLKTICVELPTNNTYDISKLKQSSEIDKSIYSKVTSNYTKPITEYIRTQTESVLSEQLIHEDEWFNKGDSIGSISSSITDDLFSSKTGNEVDSGKEYVDGNKTRKLFNGHTFLATNKSEQGSYDYNYILRDGSSNISFIDIKEAVSAKKLNTDSSIEGTYRYIKSKEAYVDETSFAESVLGQFNIARDVCKKIRASGDQDTKSKNFFVTLLGLVYHDQKFYDYMKANYSDLF